MIGPTGAVRVMMATQPVDFRKGVDGLAALVRETMGADPFSGAVYVFEIRLPITGRSPVMKVTTTMVFANGRWMPSQGTITSR